jgi:hypothetical protein
VNRQPAHGEQDDDAGSRQTDQQKGHLEELRRPCDQVVAYVDRFNHRRKRGQIQTIQPARLPFANQHAPARAAAAQQTTPEDGTGHLLA